MYKVILGDSREELKRFEENSIDSIVCDPPYELGFMGKKWDATGIAYDPTFWSECLRVLKPGGHLLSFGGSRTFHRIAVGIEDAGFEIRDSIVWHYASGMPKSHNISKAIDKKLGAQREVVGTYDQTFRSESSGLEGWQRPSHSTQGNITVPATEQAKQWDGWGTALKPSHEPIIVARKPVEGTVAENVLKHGTGGINVDACRIGTTDSLARPFGHGGIGANQLNAIPHGTITGQNATGRWPANTIFDEHVAEMIGDKAKFFFVPKVSRKERGESKHPTMKPVELMRYLVRLVTSPGGTVLDPFMGSGSTGVACLHEGLSFIGIDMTEDYCETAQARLAYAAGEIAV